MRRLLFSSALVLAAWSSGSVPVSSDSYEPVELDAFVDRSQTVVGMRVMFRVVLEHRSTLDVELRAPSDELDALPIVRSGREETRPLAGRARRTQWYSLEPAREGLLKLPSFEARFRDEAGDEQTLATENVYVTVSASPKNDPESELRDIWGPTALTELPWWWFALGALGLVLVAVVLWRFLHGAGEDVVAPLTPEELVRQRLERLATFDVSTRDGAREFCFELTEALRAHLESLCDVNASDLTTQEISTAIQTTWLATDVRTELVQVLRAADRVKFAGDRVDVSELRRLHRLAVRFVDRARPDPSIGSDSGEEKAS